MKEKGEDDMKQLIEVRALEKCYGHYKALKGISFDVREGEILCFLGPNGAGKSTTIHILSTILQYDGGEILFEGKDVKKHARYVKRNLGIVPQDLAIYEDVSAEKNVAFFAALYGLKGAQLQQSVKEALQFVGLLDKKSEKPKTFSGGMKRRLNIACAIAHKPKVIIMDEPTVGIDPQSRNHILQSIQQLQEQGSTIIYTTHYMEEVEEISTRIIIMDHGEIITEGTKEELKKHIADEKRYFIECEHITAGVEESFFKIEGMKEVIIKDGVIEVVVLKGVENLDKIITLLVNEGMKVKNIMSESASLETVFLQLTGRKLRD